LDILPVFVIGSISMDAYIYRAALYCESCMMKLEIERYPEDDWRWQDSDHSPQGPYADGGGEADTPQHCDHCGVFLENPLTDDGARYVLDAIIREWRAASTPDGIETVYDWANRYQDYYRGGERAIVSAFLEWYLGDLTRD
jgi:hypothetical protein